MKRNVVVEQINGRIQDNYNYKSKEKIRELWEFDFDDLFLEHTTEGKQHI